MTTTVSATREAVTTAPVDRAFEIGTPLTPVGFYPRSGPLPGVIAVHDQRGGWGTPGQTRRLQLSDGGSVTETIVEVDPPGTGPADRVGAFTYELSDFRGPLRVLVRSGRAEWWYSAGGASDGSTRGRGTRISWRYTFRARRGAGLVVRLIVGLLWGPYMARVLRGIARELDRRA
jgi:hypothetical protein